MFLMNNLFLNYYMNKFTLLPSRIYPMTLKLLLSSTSHLCCTSNKVSKHIILYSWITSEFTLLANWIQVGILHSSVLPWYCKTMQKMVIMSLINHNTIGSASETIGDKDIRMILLGQCTCSIIKGSRCTKALRGSRV